MSNNKKVLLYSGGMDSWLIDKIWKPDARVYVDIHGTYSSTERSRLPADILIVDFPFLGSIEKNDKFVPLRNLYFLMIGSHFGNEICLGATAGDWGNKDKTPKFLKDVDSLLSYLWQDKKATKEVTICQDFINVSKSELIDRYLSAGGTIDTIRKETFSCYSPIDGHECFCCYPCFRKFALLYAHGANYSDAEKRKMWDYVKTKIIPTKEEGGYPGTYYTDRGVESKDLIYTVEKLKKEFGYE